MDSSPTFPFVAGHPVWEWEGRLSTYLCVALLSLPFTSTTESSWCRKEANGKRVGDGNTIAPRGERKRSPGRATPERHPRGMVILTGVLRPRKLPVLTRPCRL